MDKLVPSAKADMTTKHFQVVKLELEAALKREQWEELDGLFEECWKYGGPARYDKLADLVLIIYSCMSKENVNDNYKSSKWSQNNLDEADLNRRSFCASKDYQLEW